MSAVPVVNLLKVLFILAGMAFAAVYMVHRQNPDRAINFGKVLPDFSSEESIENIPVIKEEFADELRASADLDWSLVYRGGAAQRSRVAAAISEASDLYKIDQNLIRSVIMAESMFDAQAVSSKGAKGLMQLMPTTAQEMGVKDVFDARENILGGTLYLTAMLREFDGQLALALAGYHSGPQAVRNAGDTVPFQSKMYVALVASYYELFGADPDLYKNGIYRLPAEN